MITSVIHLHNRSLSVFNEKERYEQLFKTIESVKEKIPNVYIVLLEGSEMTEDEKREIETSGVNNIVIENVAHLDKQQGEIHLLLSFLTSQLFREISTNYNIKTCSKMSGRYYFLSQYDFYSVPMDKCQCKLLSPRNVFVTTFYRFPYSHLPHFIHSLQQLVIHGILINVEHSFFQYNILDTEISTDLYVQGYIAPTGTLSLDGCI